MRTILFPTLIVEDFKRMIVAPLYLLLHSKKFGIRFNYIGKSACFIALILLNPLEYRIAFYAIVLCVFHNPRGVSSIGTQYSFSCDACDKKKKILPYCTPCV